MFKHGLNLYESLMYRQREIAVNENSKLISDYFGATCFTPYKNVLNHLMCAYYAEQHKGICLHFGKIKP